MEEKNRKLNKKTIYTVIGIAALTVALVCAVILGVKQYRLWKSQQMYEKLAQSTTAQGSDFDRGIAVRGRNNAGS